MLPVYVISLQGAATRRKSITRQLNELGIEFTFFDAIDGRRDNIPPPLPPADFMGRSGRRHSKTASACFASHYSLWQKCVCLRRPILILEDDVILGDGSRSAIGTASSIVGSNVVRLGGSSTRQPTDIGRARDGLRIGLVNKSVLGGYAYVVGPTGAQRLIDGVGPVRDPVDNYIERFWDHGVTNLAIMPWQFTQSPEVTTSIDLFPNPPRWRRLHRKPLALLDDIRREIAYRRLRRRYMELFGSGIASD